MRKITQEASRALLNKTPYTSGNTKVMGGGDNAIMTLHDNVIASIEDNRLMLTSSGWLTNTTKERLNGILETASSDWRIYQKNGAWYMTDGMGKQVEWNGIYKETI